MLLRTTNSVSPLAVILHKAGEALVKAAADAAVSYSLGGRLYMSESGYLLLSVPNALVRGAFAAMIEPGIELPPAGPSGLLDAHVTVMRPDEVAVVGGPDKITERGKQFAYSLGRLYSVEPTGWKGMSKVWYIKVHSPELQQLRRSYGLSSLPNNGEFDFHVSVAVRRKAVLGRNDAAKGN